MPPERPPTELFLQFKEAQLRASRALLDALPVTPREYPLIAVNRTADHRAFAIRRAMEHLLVAMTASWPAWDYYLKHEESEAGEAPRDNPGLWALVDQQAGWHRKLSETLVDLILFAGTNDQAFYHMYLLVAELEQLIGVSQDLSTFWGCGNAVGERRASGYFRLLQEVVGLARGRRWFFGQNLTKALGQQSLPSKLPLMQSFRQRLLLAFETGTEDERLALGQCYMFYSLSSDSAHGRLAEELQPHSVQNLLGTLTWGPILGFPILRRCQELTGIELDEAIARMARDPAFIESFVAAHRQAGSQGFESGDLVIVGGNDIAEVVEESAGKFGASNFKVRPLTRPLVDLAPTTSYPAISVQLLCRREECSELLVRLSRARQDLEGIRTAGLLLPSVAAAQLREELHRLTGHEARRLLGATVSKTGSELHPDQGPVTRDRDGC